MSLATIKAGLVATIVSASMWDENQVSTCDFGIATLSGSCVILQPGPAISIIPMTFGDLGPGGGSRSKRVEWDIAGIVMVKDPGNALMFLGQLWQACDDIFTAINADDTLNGAAAAALITNISRPSIDAFIEGEGADFGFITFNVRAHEYI